MYKILTILLLCGATWAAHSQPDWRLKRDEDGIKIFTASTPNSDIKSVKVECTVDATLSQLLAFLMDVSKQPDWVYNTRMSRLEKMVKPNELIFYSQVNVPWPCTDRDFIAHFLVQQPGNNLTTIDSRTDPTYLPHQKGFIRIQQSQAHWDINPGSGSELNIIYTLSFDPAGSVPAWLTNMFLTVGPYHTFRKLREEVKKTEYRNIHLSFLKYGT